MLRQLKKNYLENITLLIGMLYLFFSSRRGGNTRDIFSIFLIIISTMFIHKDKFQKIKKNKQLYISGILYLIALTVIYFLSKYRSDFREEFLDMTLYSIVLYLFVINIKLKKIYQKYIPIVIVIFSLGSIYRGIKDIFENINRLSSYRISGGTYTTVYAAEIGIYLLIGIIIFYSYKKWYIKILSFSYIIINLLLLICTKSRNTMIMFPLALGILLIIKYKKKGILIFCLLLLMGIITVKNASKIKWMQRLTTVSSIKNIKENSRYNIFEEGIDIGRKNYLKGVGFCQYKKEQLLTKKSGYQPHFHNIFIETFATQGIFTLILYIYFLSTIFIGLIKKKMKERNNFIIDISLASYIFCILYGLAEPIFYFGKIYQILFILLSLSFIEFYEEKK